MSSVVPYYAFNKIARRTAFGVGRMAYSKYRSRAYRYGYAAVRAGRFSARAYRAGSKISRWARSRMRSKKRARSYIGKPVGSATAKKVLFRNNVGDIDSRTIYAFDTLDIERGGANDKRERDIVDVRGMKFCFEMTNQLAKPLYVNVAVVHDKRSNDETTTVSESDFFRGNGENRSVDFSTALSSQQMHCLPLNADRFTILAHKRLRLNSKSAALSFQEGQGRNYLNKDFYIPIKRQIRYNDDQGQSKIWLLYWCSGFGDVGGGGSAIETNALSLSEHHITYFREPRR